MTPAQQRIAITFLLGTLLFAAAAQGVISQTTALFLLVGLTAVVRFGLAKYN